MKCPNCKREIDINRGEKKCYHCGYQITEAEIAFERQRLKEQAEKEKNINNGNSTGNSTGKNGKKEPERKKHSKPMVIAAVGMAAVLILITVGKNLIGQNSEQSNANIAAAEQSESTKNDILKEEGQTTAVTETEMKVTEAPSTEALPTEEPSTTEEALVELGYAGYSTPDYNVSPSDFVTEYHPDGDYSFMYPDGVFDIAYYDPDTKSYYLESGDGETILTITQQDAIIRNNPKECANTLLARFKPDFYIGTDTPYIFESKAVSESGFSRSIIGGLDKRSGRSVYICTANNNTTSYILTFTCYGETKEGIGIDYTPKGHVIDCIYRGWSISGSSYKLRTFDQFMKDDMGTKKDD